MKNKIQDIIDKFDRIDNCSNYFEEHSAIRSFLFLSLTSLLDEIEQNLPNPFDNPLPYNHGYNDYRLGVIELLKKLK